MPVSNDKTTITIYVDTSLRDFVKRQADADGRSISNYLSLLLEKLRDNQITHLADTHTPQPTAN